MGVGVDSVNLELADEGDVAKAISECSGFVIGEQLAHTISTISARAWMCIC